MNKFILYPQKTSEGSEKKYSTSKMFGNAGATTEDCGTKASVQIFIRIISITLKGQFTSKSKIHSRIYQSTYYYLDII